MVKPPAVDVRPREFPSYCSVLPQLFLPGCLALRLNIITSRTWNLTIPHRIWSGTTTRVERIPFTKHYQLPNCFTWARGLPWRFWIVRSTLIIWRVKPNYDVFADRLQGCRVLVSLVIIKWIMLSRTYQSSRKVKSSQRFSERGPRAVRANQDIIQTFQLRSRLDLRLIYNLRAHYSAATCC